VILNRFRKPTISIYTEDYIDKKAIAKTAIISIQNGFFL